MCHIFPSPLSLKHPTLVWNMWVSWVVSKQYGHRFYVARRILIKFQATNQSQWCGQHQFDCECVKCLCAQVKKSGINMKRQMCLAAEVFKLSYWGVQFYILQPDVFDWDTDRHNNGLPFQACATADPPARPGQARPGLEVWTLKQSTCFLGAEKQRPLQSKQIHWQITSAWAQYRAVGGWSLDKYTGDRAMGSKTHKGLSEETWNSCHKIFPFINS